MNESEQQVIVLKERKIAEDIIKLISEFVNDPQTTGKEALICPLSATMLVATQATVAYILTAGFKPHDMESFVNGLCARLKEEIAKKTLLIFVKEQQLDIN
mgnify:CR=1 FL=1